MSEETAGSGRPTNHGASHDYDVVVVGGGPAGCSAGIFTARAGLDSLIFDRGRSSLKRCAYLENFLGFPDGIDIESFYERMHDHARTAGCELRADLVERVERETDGFEIRPDEGNTVTARRVIAATRYDGEYMRGLDDDEAMIETNHHDGEKRERFDREYAGFAGETPVDGLYVASPSEVADMQAIMAAGRGARVAHQVIADSQREDGRWNAVAGRPDWLRREAELGEEWHDHGRWVEWFDNRYAAEAPVDPESETYERVRDSVIEEARATYIDRAEIDARCKAGLETLVEHLGPDTLLDALDDEQIRSYLDSGTEPTAGEP